jgi:hypothetical protein
MPKDATKNVDRYKVRGGQFNEFEYNENQKALGDKKPKGVGKLIPGTPPEEAGDGLRPEVKAVKATSKARKSTKTTKKASSTKGVSAKKLAARKAAAKK